MLIVNMFTLFISFSFSNLAQAETGFGFTTQVCGGKTGHKMTIPFRKSDEAFVPDCAPDTLYVWKKPEYVDQDVHRYKNRTAQEQNSCLKIMGTTFAWRTPMGSHGYGRDTIRIKLLPNTKFLLVDEIDRDCEYYEMQYPQDYKSSVFVAEHRGMDGYHEYILCSDRMIQSWSTGTSEHLQEIQNEEAWIRKEVAAGTLNYDKLNREEFGYLVVEGGTIPNWDRGNWTPEAWNESVRLQEKKISDGTGGVFFCPGEPEKRNKHFSTKTPSYFNGRTSR